MPGVTKDMQVKYYKDYKDYYDVHMTSGIPNHAFYLAAIKIGGKSWEKTGQIWFAALQGTCRRCSFKEFALLTLDAIPMLFKDPEEREKLVIKVRDAWQEVGVLTIV